MENILKVFLMAFPEWLACIFMMVGLVVTALAAVRLGYGLVVAKTVYKWIVNAEEKTVIMKTPRMRSLTPSMRECSRKSGCWTS